MYSRQNDRSRDMRIPRNYSGNVIFSAPTEDIPTKQHAPKDQAIRRRQGAVAEAPELIAEAPREFSDTHEPSDATQESATPEKSGLDSAPASLLSPIGALGTEELLIIALALIIFQGGKEPELALLLLALLFIN